MKFKVTTGRMLFFGVFIAGALTAISTFADTEARSLELISSATCVSRSQLLEECKIGPATLEVSAIVSRFVPFRTEVVLDTVGDCSTQMPIQVRIASDDGSYLDLLLAAYSPEGSKVRWRVGELDAREVILAPPSGNLRNRGRTALSKILLVDPNPWTSLAHFVPSCRTTIEIKPNVPDVDTPAEASLILNQALLETRDAISERGSVTALLGFSSIFRFMIELNQSLLLGPSGDLMLQISERVTESQKILAGSGDSGGLSIQEKKSLAGLLEGIQNLTLSPPESGKSLGEMLDEPKRKLIEELARKAEETVRLRADLKRVSEKAELLCVELTKLSQLLTGALPAADLPKLEALLQECGKGIS